MKTWSVKPTPGVGINYAHPLAQGITLELPFNEGGGLSAKEYANGLNAVLTPTTWKTTPYGIAPTVSSATALGSLPVNTRWQTAAITMIWAGIIETASDTGYLYDWENQSSPSGGGIYMTATNSARSFLRIGAAWSDPGPAYAMTAGKHTVLVVTYDGSTHKFYADGALIFANAIAGSITYDTTVGMWFGNDHVGDQQTRTTCSLFRAYNRALSASEIAATLANPWQIYTPIQRRLAVSGIATVIEQEGYRFRNDDGSESGASWLAGQDTPASVAAATPFRLRVLVNASGDPAAQNYQLEVKRSGESDAAFRKVTVKQ